MKHPLFRQIARTFGWTRDSYYLLSAFLLLCGLIVYAWWPLAEDLLAYIDWGGPWWRYFDWLLVGIWLVMSLLIMAGADLKVDAWIVFVGMAGGLVIESWGTQTEIWWYYTAERPPLWIIPAWPIASLSIDRLVRVLHHLVKETTKGTKEHKGKNWGFGILRGCPICGGRNLAFCGKQPPDLGVAPVIPKEPKIFVNLCVPLWLIKTIYWLVFTSFFVLMLTFIWPTVDKSLTVMAIILVGFLILTPTDHRIAVLTFAAGSGLGYYLELWGTTRQCWTYYTLATPPLFAVLAHGMAAVAFWRAALALRVFSIQYSVLCGLITEY